MVDWTTLDGDQLQDQPITPGATQVQPDTAVKNTSTGIFTGNISFNYTFPTGITDPIMAVGVGFEMDNTATINSEVSAANWNHAIQGNETLIQRVTETAEGASKHQRVTWLDIKNPSEGAGTVDINFQDPTDLLDGTIIVIALGDLSQAGPYAIDTDSSASGQNMTCSVNIPQVEAISLEICNHGFEEKGPWSAQSGQTVIVNADGDDGASPKCDTACGYEIHNNTGVQTQTWNHPDSDLRVCMALMAYLPSGATPIYVPQSLSYSKIRRLRM